MKILKLKSLNINSLKGVFEIDFEKFLKDDSLFAITGPTGAGKSTILDIITCALYGRTARLANPSELMSRNTGESFCEVEFEIKGKVYRSSWGINRARKKADGNFQSAKMEIVDVESAKVLESYLSKVPKVVEEISGLDFDRFIQSMMLAQGGFDAFLKAKENERSTLLQKITGTHIYKQISLAIYETYAKYKKAIELDENLLGSIELLDSSLVEEKSKALNESQKQKKELDKKEEQLKKISSWLENLTTLETQEKKYTQEFEQISKEKEDKKEQFLQLELANKAFRLQPINQEKIQTSKTITQEKQKLETLQKEYTELQKQTQIKSQELASTKEQFEKEKLLHTQNSEKLKKVRVLQTQVQYQRELYIEKTQKIKTYLHELSSSCNRVFKDPIEVETMYKNFSIDITKLKEQLQSIVLEYTPIEKQTQDINQKEHTTREQLKECETLFNALIEYENIQITINQEQEKLKEYHTQLQTQTKINEEKTKLVSQIQQTLQVLQQTREKELLIKNYEQDRVKLQNDEACYLCGSKEHPYINHSLNIDTELSFTLQKIQEQEKYLNNENQELNNTTIQIATLSSQKETSTLELEKQQITLENLKELFEIKSFKVEQNSKTVLEEQKLSYEQELKRYVSLREQKEKLQIEKEKLQTQLNQEEQKEQQIKTTLKAIDDLQKEQNSIKNEATTLQEKSKTILDIEDLDAFEKSIQNSISTITDRYNNLQNELSSLNSKDESINQQIEQLQKKQKIDQETLQTLEEKFSKALEEYGFSSTEEFEKAHLDKEQFEALGLVCKEIDEKYSQIHTLKQDTTKKLKEHKALALSTRELEKVKEELNDLQNSIDELQKSIGSIEKELEINSTNIKKHESKIKELEKKKEHFKVWVKLNDMIGSATGDKFAKFAQGITLDQLIYLANKHLNILSPRYELKRGIDSSKQLEIEIIDGFQGDVSRGVNTLSGGESFIVSLSLALGLSSLASQKISIDSLFLDEGFGTLDSDSLELALNALNQLQSSGKMVGVISHVEALKERIPLQIKVMPKGDGTSSIEMD